MPERAVTVLLDQNIPALCVQWLRSAAPTAVVRHVNELGFQGKPDGFLYQWALSNDAVVVTYDEDFADARMFPLGSHRGVIRLRVWPTTIEETQRALTRLLQSTPPAEWRGALIIIDNAKIRIRRPRPA